MKTNLKDNIIKKEIIGWRLKESCERYREAVCDIAGINKYGLKLPPERKHVSFIVGSSTYMHLKEAGVLNLWFEPVYEEEQFEVKDWVKFYSYIDQCIYIDRIKDWTSHSYCELENGLRPFKHLLKKATPKEIEKHLMAEAKEKGFKEGVVYRSVWEKNKCTLSYDDLEYFTDSDILSNGYGEAIYKNGEWAEIISSYPDITINGYKGEFFDSYVKFGCAEIDKSIFINLYNLIYTGSFNKNSNKLIENVTIGRGSFTKEHIKEIAEYYLNK